MKIIVCGTRFGQFYIEAIKQSEEFELAGILSNGSISSQQCADKYGIPLYTDIAQLPADIDMACVVVRTTVMGGEGTTLAIKLMEKGISVVLEQPVHQKDLGECYKAAKKNNVFFVLGDLYMELPSVKKFITLARGVIQQQKPLYINIDLATQVSFPLVHILTKILPTTRPWKIAHTIKDDTPFQVLSLMIGGIPIVIRAQNQVDPDISDGYLHLFHSITLGVGGGRLSMMDTHGPVTWQPRMVIPDYDFIPADLNTRPPESMLEESTLILGEPHYPTYQQILTQLWPEAILKDIHRLSQLIRRTMAEKQMAVWGQQALLCAQIWHDISNALGYPMNCQNPDKTYLSVADVVGPYYQNMTMLERYNQLSQREIETGMAQLNQSCLLAMLHQFQKNGLFLDDKTPLRMDDILQSLPVANRHHYVMRRWLKVLTEHHYLVSHDDGYRGVGIRVSDDELTRQWKKTRTLWDDRLGSPIVSAYFYQNVEALPALMNDQQQAAMILFPEGKNEVANALYRDTLIAWYLNQQVANEVEKVALNSQNKLAILEVGAGTGATADVVIERLRRTDLSDRIENYLYTDISPYFLGEANDRYQHDAWVKTQVIDLENDLDRLLAETHCFDVIIAAGVINNVKDTVAVLNKLRDLLKPEGMLLITEADGEANPMLISQIFMMESADDARKETDTTFMNAAQLQAAFSKANLQLRNMTPTNNHKLVCFGQKLFMLSKRTEK